jgi:hypothetical protein
MRKERNIQKIQLLLRYKALAPAPQRAGAESSYGLRPGHRI